MRKISAVIIVSFIVLVISCSGDLSCKKASYIYSAMDSLKIDKSKNILIYTINPNDCMNCLIGFVSLNNSLSMYTNPKVYVIAVEREIEKNELIKSTKNIDLKDSVNRSIIWDKNVFMGINESASFKKEISLSSLTIYNYQKDSIMYSKPIKEITGLNEFAFYLEKNNQQ
ncbi:MAG: hypothetical protein ACT4ON_04925 [Bacteroidota bacterium]